MAERTGRISTDGYELQIAAQKELLKASGLVAVSSETFDDDGHRTGFFFGLVNPETVIDGVFQGCREDIPVEMSVLTRTVTVRQRDYRDQNMFPDFLNNRDKLRAALAVAFSTIMLRRPDSVKDVEMRLDFDDWSSPEARNVIATVAELPFGALAQTAVDLRLNKKVTV